MNITAQNAIFKEMATRLIKTDLGDSDMLPVEEYHNINNVKNEVKPIQLLKYCMAKF